MKSTRLDAIRRDFRQNRLVYLMALPVILFYLVFHYIPMYGAIIAFKDFNPAQGIWNSPWVGLEHIKNFLDSFYFFRLLRNTVLLNLLALVFEFPAPILLALLFNELRLKRFKRIVQTVSYLPHFVSTIVVCGMIIDFTSRGGVINVLVEWFGGQRANLLMNPELFRGIYITSEIWQRIGWGAIIYLAALTSINSELYEAAIIDGAGRWKQALHITIPGIMPVVIIMLILRIGRMLDVGYEKIILLYSPTSYETADVISTFVYRKGLINFDFSYATAVGLFNSLLNFLLLLSSNLISRRINETSLW